MKQTFVKSWVSSKQPRKQRKYRFKAPLHLRHSFMHSHLSKELRTKYKTRALAIRTGDRIKIMRGQFKGRTGTVESVDLKKCKAFVTGIELLKKEGSKALYPLDPSNLQITELNLEDKYRKKILDRKGKEISKEGTSE